MKHLITAGQSRWRTVVVIVLLLSFGICAGKSNDAFYDYCKGLPSDKLLSMGHEYLHKQRLHNKALVCYTIVANRSQTADSREGKEQGVAAGVGQWYIYFFHFFNFSKSLECLFSAEKMAKEAGTLHPEVYSDLGCTYQTLAEETNDTAFYRQALDYYATAIEQSFSKGDLTTLNITMTNAVTTAYMLGRMDSLKRWWGRYKDANRGRESNLSRYNVLLYGAMKSLSAGRFNDALAKLELQAGLCKADSTFIRYLTLTYFNMGMVCIKAGRHAEAEGYLHTAEKIALANDFKDAKLDIYRNLSDIYRRQNNMSLFIAYKDRYFQIRDSLLNYHQLKSVGEIKFLSDMKKMEDELTEIKYRHNMVNILLLVFVGVAAVVTVFLVILYRKNRQLNKSNRLLYKKNVEILTQEEQELAVRKKLEEAQQHEQKPAETGHAGKPDTRTGTPAADEPDAEDIYNRIRLVMESNEAVFSPDFTAEALADLVGERQRVISRVIRQVTGSNFYALLSDYRVKEACRRFRDPRYSGLTIEAIANSVGFKSRSNFISTFKSSVGLNPSEYIRMVKEGAL